MSAIWGVINFIAHPDKESNNQFLSYYKKHCKINRYEMLPIKNSFFGCGIQYITVEACNEVLPCYNSTHNFLLTADCMLDNRSELMSELNKADTTLPDGALLEYSYIKWGIQCVNHLRGSYSFVIYDYNTDIVYLVADHMASRSLYYYATNNNLVFSTLLNPILCVNHEICKNELYIKDFLTAPGLMPTISSTETPYENVFKLNPGTYLEVHNNSIKEVCYWTPSKKSVDYNCRNVRQYGQYFRHLYEQCVADTLRNNGNIGCALSSGLDSSSVAAIAAVCLGKSNKSLYTYTYVPSEPLPYTKYKNNILDETSDVKKIVRRYPNMIPKFLCNKGRNCFDFIPQITKTLEIPFKAFGNLPSLFELFEEAASDSCKIILTGQYGNSTVSYGYIDHVLYDMYVHHNYIGLLRYLNRYSKKIKESRKKALLECIHAFKRNQSVRYIDYTSYIPDNPFLAKQIKNNYPLSQRYKVNNIPTTKELDCSQDYQNMIYFKPALTYLGEYETKVGLAFGIIIRDPTRDMRMMSFCYHLPFRYFAYNGTPRWLIRNQFRDLIPNDLLDDWQRYGVQNSDYYIRLKRDWKEIYPQIKEGIESSQLFDYCDDQQIQRFFAQTQRELMPELESDVLYLMFLYIISKFVNVN